ncbi:MAG: hypothetical protein J4F33_01830 [Alphaproteobacteria bacterium]|nr:hypothetical protein [Alphaproteobacteria bacterium]
MRALTDQYAAFRRPHPGDDLLVVFDIDGTGAGVPRRSERRTAPSAACSM